MNKYLVIVGTSEVWQHTYEVDANSEEEAKGFLHNADLEHKHISSKHRDTDYSTVLEIEEIKKGT